MTKEVSFDADILRFERPKKVKKPLQPPALIKKVEAYSGGKVVDSWWEVVVSKMGEGTFKFASYKEAEQFLNKVLDK